MSKTRVYLGSNIRADSNAVVKTVIQAELHSLYNSKGYHDHDIALLKMSSPVTFTNYIQPICLADKMSTLANGLSMWVAGWGRLTEGEENYKCICFSLPYWSVYIRKTYFSF